MPDFRQSQVMKSLGNILRILVLFGLMFGPIPNLWGHVGGTGFRPEFISPSGLVQAADEAVHIKWTDGDDEPVAIHHFFYQERNSTPEPVPELAHLNGKEIFQVAVNDTENAFTWDVTDIPQGTYFLYAETRDPPNCPTIRFAESLIVVDRQQTEPPISGLWFESPGGDGLVIDTSGSLIVRAIAPTQPSIHVRAGYTAADYESEPEDSPCLFQRSKWVEDLVVAENVVMEVDPDAGPGFWRAHIDWDTSQIPNGSFLLKTSFEGHGLQEKDIFASGWISIYHPNGLATDVVGNDTSNGGTEGCASSRGASNQTLWLFVLAFVFLKQRVLRVQQER